MKRVWQLLAVLPAVFMLAAGGSAAAPPKASSPLSLLPKEFAGWEKISSQSSADPAVADPVYANVLREYGFTGFEKAAFRRPEGRQIVVKAARFADTAGAYGAFTFYKLPEMLPEDFGDRGASLNQRALFYRANVLVEAQLDRITAMTAAELRELSSALILSGGPDSGLPTLPQYLPRQAYIKNSVKFVVGPSGLAAVGSPLPAGQIEFERGAEVAEGKYATSRGTATLLLIEYPTPQIAAGRARAFEALNHNPPPPADVTLAAPFAIKRSGPIVVLAAGQISPGEARSLLASVNYDADVTWNENTSLDQKNNVLNLLANIIFLIAILLAFALVIGLAFGGLRLLIKRFFPGRVFDRSADMEIIQLKLGPGRPRR
jgi:hypothetical protein